MFDSNEPVLLDEVTFELTLSALLYFTETSKEQISKWHSVSPSKAWSLCSERYLRKNAIYEEY
jgi:hypothetical protein